MDLNLSFFQFCQDAIHSQPQVKLNGHRFCQANCDYHLHTHAHTDAHTHTHTHTHLLNMAQGGLAVETPDSFLTLDTLLPLLLRVELRGLWVEEVFALYLPEDLMRVEPPAPWWVNTGGLREG